MNIYKITNLINNKIYIGKTNQSFEKLMSRYRNEKNNKKRPIALAIKKYGLENFHFELICSSLKNDYINKLECYFIKFFNSNNREIGYNLTEGGEGSTGRIPWNKGLPMHPNSKEALKKANTGRVGYWTGKKRDLNTMNNLQQGRQKAVESLGHGFMLGKKHSEKSKLKISKSQRKLNRKPPNRKKIICIDLKSGIPLYFDSISEATKSLKITNQTIILNLQNKQIGRKYKFVLDEAL